MLLALPLAEAQQPTKTARIAVLGFTTPEGAGFAIAALKQGLQELGYVEDRNAVFEIRWAGGKRERLSDLAKELVALKPDVIVATSTVTALAARRATTTIPIVVASAADPVGGGLVKSLARPGGNVTGLSNLSADFSPKLLEFLLAVVPRLSLVAVLSNSSNPINATIVRNIQIEAQRLNLNVLLIEAQAPAEIENAVARMARENAGALVVLSDPLFIGQRRQIAELASRNRMPSAFGVREHVEAGGLMSYGQNLPAQFRRAATYVDKILKGAKPADLPIEQATKLELVINLKTAKALGITIPQSVLVRADEVIR
jgi:putative ABC transport system substrate-binding protein